MIDPLKIFGPSKKQSETYLIITRKDGKFFKKYSPGSKVQFLAHREKSYVGAMDSVDHFKKRGIHAKIYADFRRRRKT